jgi:hypothetical protein
LVPSLFEAWEWRVRINYVLSELTVHCVAIVASDKPKADHLDQLLNLSDRWTRKFKAEYLAKQKELSISNDAGEAERLCVIAGLLNRLPGRYG